MRTSSALASGPSTRSENALALGQGAIFLACGVWPLVHLPSFQAVTGPKADEWLVRTVGSLLGVTGGVLISAGLRRRITPEIRALAVGSAGVLTAIDCIYAAKGRISRVYLLDAALELGFIAGWAMAARRRRRVRKARERVRPSPEAEAIHAPA